MNISTRAKISINDFGGPEKDRVAKFTACYNIRDPSVKPDGPHEGVVKAEDLPLSLGLLHLPDPRLVIPAGPLADGSPGV